MEDGSPGEWIRAAASGDQGAWNTLVDRYTPMIWSIARSYRLGTEETADVVQTTWLRLVEHLDRINEPDRVGGWIGVTARNECLGHLRRQGRYGYTTDDMIDVVDLRPGPDHRLIVEERDTVLWSALGAISRRCQQLLRVLASEPPPSYKEVSDALDMPVGSIGPVRARCLEALRRQLAENPPQTDVLESQ